MEISYAKDAYSTLVRLVNYIEEKNTDGAGLRWLTKYKNWLSEKLSSTDHIKLCNNTSFKKAFLKCIYYHDWVIAFSIREGNILIEALLHKSRIED